MLHGFVLSELRRILNAGVRRLEIGRLDSSCLDRILNFRFESRDTVARRCEKCEWARVHSGLGRMGRTQVGTAEIRIGVEILSSLRSSERRWANPAPRSIGWSMNSASALQRCYGAQASADLASCGMAMMDMTVAV